MWLGNLDHDITIEDLTIILSGNGEIVWLDIERGRLGTEADVMYVAQNTSNTILALSKKRNRYLVHRTVSKTTEAARTPSPGTAATRWVGV